MTDDPTLRFKDMRIDDDSVRVRIYEPITEKKRAGLIFIHGGGWSIGNPSKRVVDWSERQLLSVIEVFKYKLTVLELLSAAFQISVLFAAIVINRNEKAVTNI